MTFHAGGAATGNALRGAAEVLSTNEHDDSEGKTS
jgi:hypothetical protein